MIRLNELKFLFWAFLLGGLMVACQEEETNEEPPVPVNESPIAPSNTNGRPNKYLGCVEISSRSVDIEVWDHGTVDGDIISLIVNGSSGAEETILDRHELDGPSSSYTMQHSFAGNGYNYLTLYAHNEGSISPNTATISIDGNDFTLSSNLSENGYVDIVVTGYGVDCSNSSGGSGGSGSGGSGGGGSGGGGSGGGGGTSEGDLTIWTQSDLGCGFIDVTLNGDTEQLTHYYGGGNPGCGASGCANYYDLPYGTYSYSATSDDGCTWSGSVSIDEDCTTIEFTL